MANKLITITDEEREQLKKANAKYKSGLTLEPVGGVRALARIPEQELNNNIGDAIAYGAESGWEGVKSGLNSAQLGARYLAADKMGMDNTADKLENELRLAEQNALKNQQEIASKYNTNFGGVANTVQGVTSATVSTIPAVVLGALATAATKNPAVGVNTARVIKGAPLAETMVQAGGNAINQAIGDGATTDEALKFGGAKAVTEGIPEYLFKGIKYMPGTIDIGEKLAGKVANETVKKATRFAGNMAGEGIEEGIVEIADPFLKNATYSEGEKVDWNAVRESAMIGALTGGVMNAGITGIEKSVNALPNVQKVQQKDQNRAFEALHGQKMEQKNADASQNAENALGQEIVDAAIKNTLQGNKALQNQSSQADFVKNTIENVMNQKPVQNAPKMDTTISEMETVGAKNAQANYETKPTDEESSNVYGNDFNVNELPEEERAFFSELNQRFGGSAKLSKNLPDDVNGIFHNGEVILNANKLSEPDTIRFATVHEFGHKMEGTAEYDSIQEMALKYFRSIADDPEITDMDLVEYIKGTRQGTKYEIQSEKEAYDELTTMFMEMAFDDVTTIDKICVEQPSLAHRILEFIEQKIHDYNAKKGLSKLEKQQYDMLAKTRRLYVRGLRKTNQKVANYGETRYMFAGENSRTADREALTRAKQMESDGADMESIRQATGWFKSKVTGNKWAYEIDDSKSDYTFMGNLNRLKDDPEYAEYMQMENNLSSLDFNANPELEARYEYLFRKFAGTGRSNRGKASDFVSHDELFEAYPQLANMNWYQKELNGGNGQYTPSTPALDMGGFVTINKSVKDPLKTSLHEMQHAIQEIEGFPSGSSPEHWKLMTQSADDWIDESVLKERKKKIITRMDEIEAGFDFAEYYDELLDREMEGEITSDEVESLYRKYLSEKSPEYAKLYSELHDDVYKKLKGISERKVDYNSLYENTAGEIMARDTASRNYMNAERRKQQQPKMGDENTVYADGWSSYSLDSDLSDKRSIIEKLQENTEAINNHGIVSRVYGRFAGEKTAKQIRNEAKTMFDELNNGVYRKGFGRVTLNKKGVKDSLSHGTGELKNIAFEAIPDVIRDGIEIDFQSNWKGKGYDTRIFAGVILVDGEPMQMGVVVRSGDDYNKYYLHEVYIGNKKNKASSTKPGSGSTGDQLYPRGTSLSLDDIIPENSQKVNDGVRYSLPIDKEYLDAVNRGDMETAQRMVDEAAKNAGYSERLYHQTGSVFSSFNTDNQASGKYDYIMPTGIFLKPDDRDIGLRGKLQMGLYANIKNPLKFRDRTEMQNYWFENLPNYKNLFRQIEENDVEYKNRIDIAMDKMRQSRQDFFDGKITAEDRTRIREEANAESDRLFAEWREANNELSLQMKGMIDNYMDSLDFDSVIVENDEGAFGRSTKAYIVFDPNQLKSADVATYDNEVNIVPLSQRFDASNTDIRYSTGSSRYQQRINEIKNIKHKREVSKVYSNTIKNSTLFTEAEKNIELNASEYEYDVKSEKESLHRAAERLENDHAGTSKELMHKKMYTGEDLDAAMFLLQESIESGRETGNYSHAKAWLKKIQEAGTESGRMIQAYAKYSRTTAEGIAVQAERYVQQAEDSLKAGHAKGKIAGKEIGKDKDSRKWQKVEGEVKKAQKAVEDAEVMASKSAQKELEMRVKAYKAKHYKTNPNPKAKPEPDFADKLYKKVLEGTNLELEEKGAITGKQIVDELYQKLKENGMPDYRGQREKRNYTSLEYLKDAVQRKAEYAEVFEKTQEYMKAEYGNDPEVLQLIKDAMNGNFSNLKLDSVYSKKTVEKAVKETAELFDIDFKEIIKQSKGDKDEAAQVIVNHIMQFTDVPDADAKKLANDVVNVYYNELKRMTDQRLKQLFPELVQPQLKKASKKKTTWFENVMELINLGAYDNQDIVDIIKQKNDLPVLTSADIETIYSEVEKANQYKKYSYEWKSHMAKAQQVAADKMPQSMKNKVTQLKRIMMLSNPRTDVRNLAGNMPLTGTEMMSNAIASIADKKLSEKRGTQRTISAKPELGAFAQGFAKGFGETVSDIKQGVNTYRMGEESTTQYEMPRGRTFDNAFLNGIDKAVNYGLMFGDRPFFEGHYNKRMAELERLGYDITSDEAKADAYGHAVDMVFQSDSDMAKGASGIREALNSFLTIGDAFALGDFVIPFVQTPANIADKLIDYSPLGLARAAWQVGKSNTEVFDQKLFCQRLGRSLTGMSILVVSYELAKAGILTGSSDDDPEKRRAMEVSGWKPYSIKIGNTYYDYSFIQPVGMLMAIGADMYKEGQSVDDLTDLVAVSGAGIKGGVNCFFNMSFFSSLTDFFGGYGDAASNMGKAVLDFPAQFAPAVVNAANKSIDAYQRETYDSDPIKRTINKFVAKTPASQTLPKKLDVYGNEMMHNQGRNAVQRTIENMLFPSTVSQKTPNALNDELLRLNKSTGSKSQFLSYPDNKLDLGSAGEYRLSGEERNTFIKNANGYASEQMSKLIQTKEYKVMSDAKKVKVLSDIEKYAKYLAEQKLAESHGKKFVDEDYEKIKKSRIEPYKYYVMTDFMSNITGDGQKAKRISYLEQQKKAGVITDEQYWYMRMTKAGTPSKADIKDCPYAWIKAMY